MGLDARDGLAIDPTKRPLRELGKASAANISNFQFGLTGVMVDIEGVRGTLKLSDFTFKTGDAPGSNTDPDRWAAAPRPTGFTVLEGGGEGGSDRVVFRWSRGDAVKGAWLQVTALPTSRTGLLQHETFYFGSAVGDTLAPGSRSAETIGAQASDANAVLRRMTQTHRAAGVGDRLDFNKDGFVNRFDATVARHAAGVPSSKLRMIKAPLEGADRLRGEALGARTVRLTWRDTSSAERGYRVTMTTPEGWRRVVAVLPKDGTDAIVQGLRPNKNYTFKVEPLVPRKHGGGVEALSAETVSVSTMSLAQSEAGFYKVSLKRPAFDKGEAGYSGVGAIDLADSLADHQMVWADGPRSAIFLALKGEIDITSNDGSGSKTYRFGSEDSSLPNQSAGAFVAGKPADLAAEFANFDNPLLKPGAPVLGVHDHLVTLEDTWEWTDIDEDFEDFWAIAEAVPVQMDADPVALYSVPLVEAGRLTTVSFTLTKTNAEAAYNNQLAVFLVDDEAGSVDGLLPGQPGYAQAALGRADAAFRTETPIGTTYSIDVPAGRHLSYLLVRNDTLANARQLNPTNDLQSQPVFWFLHAEANPDAREHFIRVDEASGLVRYHLEDQVYLGDADFDDLEFTVDSSAGNLLPSPIEVTAAGTGIGRVALIWQKNPVNTTVGYRLYRSTTPGFTPGPANLVVALPANTHRYLDAGLSVGMRYYYVVSSIDALGNESIPSVVASAVANDEDTDIDNDGVPNSSDSDSDNDGIPDSNESDDDRDGIPDLRDQNDTDNDNDGVPNWQDTDHDNDGIPDGTDTDHDNDGTPDLSDDDDDNDRVLDRQDQGDGDDDNDGIVNGSDPDDDNDGQNDSSDGDDDNDGTPDGSDPDDGSGGDSDGDDDGGKRPGTVVVDFDKLAHNATVTTQYPGVTFSAGQGAAIKAYQHASKSSPNAGITFGPALNGDRDAVHDVYLDFEDQVDGVKFYVGGDNTAGNVGTVRVFGADGLLGTAAINVDGQWGGAMHLVDLTAFTGVTRIEITNITDAGGLSYDDFTFTTAAIRADLSDCCCREEKTINESSSGPLVMYYYQNQAFRTPIELELAAEVTPEESRDQAKWVVTKRSGGAILVQGDFSAGDIATFTLNPSAGQEAGFYDVAVGFDEDGDGTLKEGETQQVLTVELRESAWRYPTTPAAVTQHTPGPGQGLKAYGQQLMDHLEDRFSGYRFYDDMQLGQVLDELRRVFATTSVTYAWVPAAGADPGTYDPDSNVLSIKDNGVTAGKMAHELWHAYQDETRGDIQYDSARDDEAMGYIVESLFDVVAERFKHFEDKLNEALAIQDPSERRMALGIVGRFWGELWRNTNASDLINVQASYFYINWLLQEAQAFFNTTPADFARLEADLPLRVSLASYASKINIGIAPQLQGGCLTMSVDGVVRSPNPEVLCENGEAAISAGITAAIDPGLG